MTKSLWFYVMLFWMIFWWLVNCIWHSAEGNNIIMKKEKMWTRIIKIDKGTSWKHHNLINSCIFFPNKDIILIFRTILLFVQTYSQEGGGQWLQFHWNRTNGTTQTIKATNDTHNVQHKIILFPLFSFSFT